MTNLPVLPAAALAALARSTGGVFTMTQANAAGLSRSEVLALLRRGVWRTLHPAVYVSATTALTAAVREAGALALLGPDAVLSHATAARRHGLELRVREDRVFATVPIGQHVPRRPGLFVMRTRHPCKPCVLGDAAVTPLPRTVVDLARDLTREDLRDVLADAVRRKGLTVERVLSAAEGMGGRAGLLDLRAACDELDPSLESVLEEEALPHLLKLGLGDLVRQYEVRDREGRLLARLDFACVRLRLAIEVDGWASHSDPVARSRDSRRDRLLTAEGWTVVRVTTHDVRRRPRAMLLEVARVVARLEASAA